MTKKRSRLGDPALASPATAPPDAKRRALAKTGTAPAKPGRKPKAAGEESRLGAKRQKKETDVKFEESCQCVLGARVGVWWEDDNCYYKARQTLLSFLPYDPPILKKSALHLSAFTV